jgi:hypothetical protein
LQEICIWIGRCCAVRQHHPKQQSL